LLLPAVLYLILSGCSDSSPTDPPAPVTIDSYTCQVVNFFPHDSNAFTQGLQWVDSLLVEGTGLLGQSTLRLIDLTSGQVLYSRPIPGGATHFGEGICVVDDRIYQLTWQGHIGFIYDKNTFDSIGYFTYPTEGWGLTHDGTRFILSDGTSRLYFWDTLGCHDCGGMNPDTIPHITVHDTNNEVTRLNELEFIKGEVYANVWLTDQIVRVNPANGSVTARIDCAGLLTPTEEADADVLNGIAYDPAADRLFLTGKRWPKLFEVELIKTEPSR